jgi:TetR/AcrR family fatty acid metabolism transcriptional regulator
MSNHSSKASRGSRSSARGPGGAKTTERSGDSSGKSGGDPGKRERILDAAVRVFAKEGFYGAKVAQIAQAAGVADGTIYLYFKSKDDLLISLFEDRMDRVNATLREAISSSVDPVDCIRRIVRLHLELVQKNRHMAEVVTVELRQSAKFIKEYANPKFGEFLHLIANAVAEGQSSGVLRADVDPAIFARALFGALDEIALAWLVKGKERIDLPRAAEQLANLFIDGLRVTYSKKVTTTT